jgi:hypothetical protein
MIEILILFLISILILPIGMIIMTLSWGIVFSIGKMLGFEDD